MAWRRIGPKTLSESGDVVRWCIYASIGLNELRNYILRIWKDIQRSIVSWHNPIYSWYIANTRQQRYQPSFVVLNIKIVLYQYYLWQLIPLITTTVHSSVVVILWRINMSLSPTALRMVVLLYHTCLVWHQLSLVQSAFSEPWWPVWVPTYHVWW